MSISVSNNADGTFTVSCGTDTVIIGAPNAQKATSSAIKPGRRGGKVVGGVVVSGGVASTSVPHGAIQVRDADELMTKLKSEVSAAGIARAAGHAIPKEVHFSLKGLHSFDVGKLSAITGGHSPFIVTHIHIGRDHG
jgi:hypothetical protein